MNHLQQIKFIIGSFSFCKWCANTNVNVVHTHINAETLIRRNVLGVCLGVNECDSYALLWDSIYAFKFFLCDRQTVMRKYTREYVRCKADKKKNISFHSVTHFA